MDYRSRLDLYLPSRRLSPTGHESKFLSYQHYYYPQKGRTALIGARDLMDGAYIFCQGPHVHYCCPCVCPKRRHFFQGGQTCKVEPTLRSRRRRNRTVYTDEQTAELEEVFKGKKYLDSDEKQQLAEKLEVKTENIEIWFKNRRSKWRKHGKAKQSLVTPSATVTDFRGHMTTSSAENKWAALPTQNKGDSKE